MKNLKKNILYYHSGDELYGADRSLLRIVTNLGDEFLPFVILPNDLPYRRDLSQVLRESNIWVRNEPIAVLRKKYLNVRGLLKLGVLLTRSYQHGVSIIREKHIRIVHSNSMAVLTGGLVATSRNIPHLWHIREIVSSPRWFMLLMTKIIECYATKIICVSNAVKDNLLAFNPNLSSKVSVIYNGIDATFFLEDRGDSQEQRQYWGAGEDTVIIGVIGRISRFKGQSFFIEALSKMGSLQKYKAVLVGGCVIGEEWRLRELKDQVSRVGLSHLVTFEDFRADVVGILQAIDIFVLPSVVPDPFPNVVLEAMAAAKPVVATAHGGPTEQIVNGITGFLVSAIDPQDMASKIEFLIQNPDVRKSMGQAGRERVLRMFSLSTHIKNILAMYHEIIDEQNILLDE